MKVQIKKDLAEIATDVKNGKLSPQEGMNLVAADICEFPYKYGLHVFDEEFRSELILRLLQKGQSLFSRYNPEHGQFKTFLCSLIRFQIRDLLKINKNLKLSEKNLSSMCSLTYEESFEKYNGDEYSLKFAEFKPYTPSRNDKVPYANKNKLKEPSSSKVLPELGKEQNFIDYMGKYKKINPVKKTALVLALKSCYYLTDEYFEYLSDFCEIPRESLIKVVNELKDSVSSRTEKISKMQNSRDKSFHLKNKLMEEMENQISTDKKAELKHFYEIHNKNWETKINTLKKNTYFPAPTNRKVADALGICERQVGYYLQKAEKIVDEYLRKKAKK